jgi:hypothetical protein
LRLYAVEIIVMLSKGLEEREKRGKHEGEKGGQAGEMRAAGGWTELIRLQH